jgi:tetratricopeptide (TPR) repeat protein
MRRILICVLLTILSSARFLSAQDSTSELANLSNLSHSGRLPELIQAANSLLATDKLMPSDQGMVLIYLGYAYQQRGEFTKATASYEKALTVVNSDGQHPSDYAATLATLATVYAQIGQIDTAKRVLLRSIKMFENESDHAGAAMVWNDLATIAADMHSRGDAHKDMTRSVAESQLATNMSPGELAALATTEGRIAELDGDPHTAISDYEHALDLWTQTHKDQQPKTAWLYVLLGGAYLEAGDIANARDTTSRGLAMLDASSGRQTPRYFAAEIVYSKVLDASGAHDEASRLRKEAQASMNTGTDQQRAKSEISVNALR